MRTAHRNAHGGTLSLPGAWTSQLLAAAANKHLGELELAVALAALELTSGATQPVVSTQCLRHLVGGGGEERPSAHSEASISRALRRLSSKGILELTRVKSAHHSEPRASYVVAIPKSVENLSFNLEPGWKLYHSLHKTRRRSFCVLRRHLRWALRQGTDGAKSRLAVLLALSHRCLFLKGKEWNSSGRSKAKDLAELLGLSKRTVDARRRELELVGILIKEESPAWARKLYGEAYRLNLKFAGTEREAAMTRQAFSTARTATRNGSNQPQTATLRADQSPSLREGSRTNHQGSGFYRVTGGKRFPVITPAKLKTFQARMKLFDELVETGWLEEGVLRRTEFEGSCRNAYSATTARSRRSRPEQAAAILAYRVQNQRLSWCTDAAEASVYERVKQYLAPKVEEAKAVIREKVLSKDGQVIRHLVGKVRTGELLVRVGELAGLLSKQGWPEERSTKAIAAFESWSGTSLVPEPAA